MSTTRLCLTAALLALSACRAGDEPPPDTTAESQRRGVATAIASGRGELSPDQLEAGRHDDGWRRFTPGAGRGQAGGRTGMPPAEQSWDDISPATVNGPAAVPLTGDVAGPSVAKLQILLARARFSPGIIDGRWGKNTEKAVYWFQATHGLEATGEADAATVDALLARANGPQVRQRRLTEQDVAGPFVDVPEDIYERAELDCLCYQSLREKLGEVFHSSPEFLEQLNPGVDLNRLSAGDALHVPAVDPFHADALPEGRYTGGNEVRHLVVSDGGHFVHAYDAAGRRLYHFPSTLGGDYTPSPTGEWVVESINFHPDWHYQPELLADVDPEDDDAIIPAGPNNDVGVVWMALSKPHYGIHGTRAPESIGYTTSSGCVRLTNWDAAFLGRRIAEGATVEFTHVTRQGE
jgi:lipoprotein-anchoring transpeptidase ErfK/SrfK